MPKPSLLSGAKEFLEVVFAHRIRQREQFVASFRLSPTSKLPSRAAKDGARFLSDWKPRADWTEI